MWELNIEKNLAPRMVLTTWALHIFLPLSAEDELILAEEAAEEPLLNHLEEARSHLSPAQAQRLHARFALKKKLREIAGMEVIGGSCASASISGAVRKLRKYFKRNNWLRKKED